MTDHQSDAELYMERLVEMAMDHGCYLAWLPIYDRWTIIAARADMADLMLSLAVWLESGGKQ